MKEQEFDLSKISIEPTIERRPITLWIPLEEKMKFDEIQARSKKEFGKYIQSKIVEWIGKVELK